MTKKNKYQIKYLKRNYIANDLDINPKESGEVPNPTHYKNLPDGEYLLRGDKKDHFKEYVVINNIWYLTKNITTNNGDVLYRIVTYELFPNLPEKEWNILNKVVKKLTPYWQKIIYSRNVYLEKRKMLRRLSLLIYRVKNKLNNNDNPT